MALHGSVTYKQKDNLLAPPAPQYTISKQDQGKCNKNSQRDRKGGEHTAVWNRGKPAGGQGEDEGVGLEANTFNTILGQRWMPLFDVNQ